MFFENQFTRCCFRENTENRIKIGVQKSFATKLKIILYLIRLFDRRFDCASLNYKEDKTIAEGEF